MIYPREIVAFVGGDAVLRDRFPHVVKQADRRNLGAMPDPDPDHAFERWILGEGSRRSPAVRRYLTFLGSMEAIFKSIERRFPQPPAGTSGAKDAAAVQTSVDEMLVLARYLYYLHSYGIGGDVLECGCFKGFSSCCLSWACSYFGRRLIVADSFQGLPDDPSQSYYVRGEFKGTFEEVKSNLATLGRIEVVDFLPGYFCDSLQGFRRPICMIWMDVDLESSARDVLNNAFDSLVREGPIFSHELFDGRDFEDGRLRPTAGPAKALADFYRDRNVAHAAEFCEGCLGLTVPRTEGPLAFSRSRQRLYSRALALETAASLRDHAEAGPAHALRRSLRLLRRVPVVGGALAAARNAARRAAGR